MNFYQLIKLSTRAEAEHYGQRLPCEFKIVPLSDRGVTQYAVDVPRSYMGGRL